MKRTVSLKWSSRLDYWTFGPKRVVCGGGGRDMGFPANRSVKITVSDRPLANGKRVAPEDPYFSLEIVEPDGLISVTMNGVQYAAIESEVFRAVRRILGKPKLKVFYFRVENGQAAP